ncbi:MAG TPA: response regulator transcription factor [Stenomitos sp.]
MPTAGDITEISRIMIGVLLVEDQEIVRRGLKTLLETQPDLHVVGEAEQGQQAVQQVALLYEAQTPPNVILMDIRMPLMDGVEATRVLCQQYSGIKILILTTFNDTQYVKEAIRFGAKGFLLKDTPVAELAEAIRRVHEDYTLFGPGILEKMMAESVDTPAPALKQPPPGLMQLTVREREVLRLIAAGASNREIAQTLFLSEGTVRNHITHILTRLNVRDRTQAAILANDFMECLNRPNA